MWSQIRLLLEQSDLGPPCLLLYLNVSVMLGNLFAADNFSRRHISDAFFLCALRVNVSFKAYTLNVTLDEYESAYRLFRNLETF